MEAFEYHVYICNQEKPEGIPCCRAHGAEKVIDAMRKEVVKQDLATKVQLTTCGSIGLCNWGPNMIVYPDGIWYTGVTIEYVPEIVREHFQNGRPVERLIRSDIDEVRAEIDTNKAKMMAGLQAKEAAGVLPDKLMEDFRGFQISRMLLTAVDLDLFTAVGSGATAVEAAEKMTTDVRATTMLLNALAAYGLLIKEDETYRVGEEAARYLMEGAPDDSRMSLMHTVSLWQRWHTLTDCVREGTSVTYTDMKERDPKWTEAFIAAMHKSASFRAQAVARVMDIGNYSRALDVGGGSGAYAIAFAKANPTLQAEVLDLENVVPITQRHIDEAEVGDRVTARIGDLRSDKLGAGYDLVFISAIYHMLDEKESLDLTERAFESLSPGGNLVLQDFILNPEKTAPFTAALFALNMLVGTRAGSSYSIREYTHWLKEAGFEDIRHVPLPGPTGLVVGKKPETT
jgi:(2Fe-2S) ferredoxin/2-polyprenyl-3-methyl-5-hydroxy-6-metoxy-1,4-benzoquinol methylase